MIEMERLKKSRCFFLVGILTVALALCAFTLSGCSSGGQDDPQLQKNFQGTWKLCGMTEGDEEYSESDMALIESFGGECSLTLNEDKTAKFVYFGESEEGTWEVKDASAIKLKVSNDSTEVTLKDEKLTVSEDNVSLTFKKES